MIVLAACLVNFHGFLATMLIELNDATLEPPPE